MRIRPQVEPFGVGNYFVISFCYMWIIGVAHRKFEPFSVRKIEFFKICSLFTYKKSNVSCFFNSNQTYNNHGRNFNH